MVLIEPDYVLDESLVALLARAGVRIGDGVIVDPNGSLLHRRADDRRVPLRHPSGHAWPYADVLSRRAAARGVHAAPDVQVVPLALSSAESYVISERLANRRRPGSRCRRPRGPSRWPSEGRISETARPFRLIVAGDADFASNSFFPYLGNSDLVLAGIAWLAREERAPTMKPPVEVLPTVTLTGAADARHLHCHGVVDAGPRRVRGQRDVVAAAMSRLAWAGAALAAIAFLAALALTGGRGGPGLVTFTPDGLLTIPAAETREVDIAGSIGQWNFVRGRVAGA